MTDEKPATSRVAMEWPIELKEAVREAAGPRGLTDFAIEAVRAKLGTYDVHKENSEELNEVRFLAQRLADVIALGGDYEDPAETLRLLELPAWIDTTGWPDKLKAVVKDEDEWDGDDYMPERTELDEYEFVPSERRPVEDVELPAVGDPGTIRSEPPVAPKGDLLERLRTKAQEKGVDLSGVDLKPASEIERPDAIPASDTCPNCGSELVAGECWEC